MENNDDIDNRITEVLEKVGMEDKKDKRPHELSGGEQQRIAIARALLNTPKIIIADEPTGNLDPETADNIVSLLHDITSSGTAVVMSTHNLPIVDKHPGIVYRCEKANCKDKQLIESRFGFAPTATYYIINRRNIINSNL